MQANPVSLNHGARESPEHKSRAILLYSRTDHGFCRLLLKLEDYMTFFVLNCLIISLMKR